MTTDDGPTCARPECGLPWHQHEAFHGPPTADAIAGQFPDDSPIRGLYCPPPERRGGAPG